MSRVAMTARIDGFSVRRVGRIAAAVLGLGAGGLLLLGRWESALSLTAAGGVAIINLRWLDAVVERLIQPDKPRLERGTLLRLIVRMGLLGVVAVGLVVIPRVDAMAVAAGFTVPLVVLLAEGVRSSLEEEG